MMKKPSSGCNYGKSLKVERYCGPYVSATSPSAHQTFLRILLDAAPRLIGSLGASHSLNLSPRPPLKIRSLKARYGFDEIHRHLHVEIAMGIENCNLFIFNDQVHRLRAGDIIVLPPNESHCDTFEDAARSYQTLWYALGVGIFSVHLISYLPTGMRKGFHRLGSLMIPLKGSISLAETLCEKPLAIDALKEILLFLTWRAVTVARQGGAHAVHPVLSEAVASSQIAELYPSEAHAVHPLIAEATKIIDKEFAEPLTVGRVARRLGITRNYLSMLFVRGKAISFTRYLQQVRLTQVQLLLKDPTLQIKAISRSCGFQSCGYSSNLFKQTFGMTPSEYRKDASRYFV